MDIMNLLKDSFETLKKPTMLVKRKDKADLTEAVKNFAIGGAIGGLIGGVLSAFFQFIMSVLSGNVVGAFFQLLLTPIFMIVFAIILAPIGNLIMNGLYYLVAKALGGKATYAQQTYLVSIPSIVGLAISVILSAVPFIGSFILAPLFGLYLLYITVVVIRDVHQLEIVKAAAAVILPIIAISFVVMVLAAILAVLFASLLGGLFVGGAAAGMYGN
ncbi:hypothetical protein DRN67_03250 [Candidatus Micrarchaeota archaeon]|nr:MAG: hypothetical protein DRN67_03250 [Candidatus Micrarchaeota archaeon]